MYAVAANMWLLAASDAAAYAHRGLRGHRLAHARREHPPSCELQHAAGCRYTVDLCFLLMRKIRLPVSDTRRRTIRKHRMIPDLIMMGLGPRLLSGGYLTTQSLTVVIDVSLSVCLSSGTLAAQPAPAPAPRANVAISHIFRNLEANSVMRRRPQARSVPRRRDVCEPERAGGRAVRSRTEVGSRTWAIDT